ncbi:MAG: KGG domain-containing protein [Candidatus Obscuribacterales bacterium]
MKSALQRREGRSRAKECTANEFDSQSAAEAGRKGGKAVSQNRQHMSEIGKKGGLARAKSKLNADQAPQELELSAS